MSNPPYAANSDTSQAAAESIKPNLQRLEKVVLDCVRAAGHVGRTCDEVEVQAALAHQTASARINSLVKRGKLIDTLNRRPTRSGRTAAVYVAA